MTTKPGHIWLSFEVEMLLSQIFLPLQTDPQLFILNCSKFLSAHSASGYI